jgi:Aerotolerance regulator N-terminal/von Willebrand factor type A domain
MSWITPQLGAIVAAAAVPLLVILYFLKLRRQDVEVSSTFLWKKAIQDLQANAPFQRLRRNLLLFLQLLILAGLCFGLAQPQVSGQVLVGNRHVLLIDRSASMQATDERDAKGQPLSRFDAAKRDAISLVDSLSEGGLLTGKDSADEAMVIAFDAAAEVRQQFTTDKRALRAAIEGITPSEAPTRAEEAFRLAQAHKPRRLVEGVGMESGPPMTVHLFSDGRIADALKARSDPNDTVEYHRLGHPDSANLAVVGLRAAREYDAPSKLSVYVSLQNNQTSPRKADVELLVDGVSARIKTTTIAGAETLMPEAAAKPANGPGAAPAAAPAPAAEPQTRPGQGGLVFNLDLPGGATIEVRLRDPSTGEPLKEDVLQLDDRAVLVVPPAKQLAVLVVSTEADSWLDNALAGLPLSRLTKIDPPRFSQWTQEGRLGEYDVIILENWVPSAGPKGEPAQLPPGGYLIVGGVVGPSLGMKVVGKTPPAGIVDWSSDHPALRNISLSQLRIAEMKRVELIPATGSQSLVMSDEGPAMIESSMNGVHAITLPFRIDDTRWALSPSFVVFMGAAVRYLGEDVGAGSTIRDVQPGSVITDRLPAGASDITLKMPDQSTLALKPSADGRVTFGPLRTSGVYEVSWKGPAGPTDRKGDGTASRGYAANLADAAESDIGAREQVSLGSTDAKAKAGTSANADRRLWPYLLLAAVAIAMFEWFIYNRKVYL